MVLMKSIYAVLFLSLCGCLPKTSVPVLLTDSKLETEVRIQDNQGEWSTASEELVRQFQDSLEVFGEHDVAGISRLKLELSARYFSQLQGQHRWTVNGTLSLYLDVRQPEQLSASAPVELAVFLDYPHQGEEDALEAALPLLKRQVQDLIQSALPSPSSSN